MSIPDNTPILVGAGQYVEREASLNSPMHLASCAAKAAIADTGGSNVAAAIDTIAVVKLFSDSTKMWACPFGRSDNPPQSIAAEIGANPQHRIYTQTGGNQPQSLIIEMAQAIARGEKSMVLLAGAEAIRNQRSAERNDQQPDWNESFDAELEDRGFGEMVATNQERKNGMIAPLLYYILIEQARRQRLGLSVEDYLAETGKLLESFSAIAANNPYSQFAGAQTAEEILGAAPLTHLYTRRMIAQDGVNQAAALLVCSVGKAKELGIPQDRWIYLHGMAEGTELDLSHRADPSASPMAAMVVDQALAMAEKSVAEMDLIDIYSCFPCAVTAISDHLGLPADGSVPLTLTGGLPYFGGAGNN
jgi:acetyl-CoA C-acetyltransferase